jgi:peptidyl-prolyl cis-trans isomerase B (cyclophilin B)
MAEKNPVVKMETDKGTMMIELFINEAPGTVKNFISLIEKGFYDGLTFHRVIDNFMIQGGCPKGTGTGDPGYKIKCETQGNPHKHQRGSLSMAHAGKDTGGSQFFICHSPQKHLDGVHTVFGKVVEGLDVVDKIRKDDHMKKVTVEKHSLAQK